MRLTRPEVVEVLSKVALVVHTLVPEKYFGPQINKVFVVILLLSLLDLLVVFWHLITILSPVALDYSRLHQPADLTDLPKGLKDSKDLCFSRGVAFMAERGNACVRFKDIEGNVRLDPTLSVHLLIWREY